MIASQHVIILIFFVSLLKNTTPHDHGHSHEPPHLKYTREVNEAVMREENDRDQFQHTHSHLHGHDEDGSHSHDHGHGHHTPQKSSRFETNKNEYVFDENSPLAYLNNPHIRLWVYAVGSTLLISAVPCLLLTFVPIQADATKNSVLLKILLAFGAGGLLGDAFLHLIPHALPTGSHSHSHSHTHSSGHMHEPHDLSVGGGVLFGFIAFFVVEKFVRIMRGSEGHGHSHQSIPNTKKSNKKNKSNNSDKDDDSCSEGSTKELIPPLDSVQNDNKSSAKIAVAAFLNLVADFMHNFTDGLAIGASYIAGNAVGMVTMVTVLVHEVPHEIGDFAILVQAGFPKKKAILIQLVTALGALAGCVLSLWSVDASALAEAAEHSWVLPFTAGGFIYIASSSIIPELLEDSKFFQSIGEVFALLLGIFMMYLIALYE